MRILVTGGLGFIGSTLVEHYADQGHIVDIVDDLSNPTARPSELPVDLALLTDLVVALDEGMTRQPDLVVHCASPVGAAGVLKYKGRLAWKIANETHAVVEYCRTRSVPLVNISTSEVYGFSGEYHESDDLRVPAVPNTRIQYALGKLAAESECRLTPGLKSVSVRPFNVVGARQSAKGGFVLPTFAAQARKGEDLTVYGDGSQVRALTSVHDIARFVTGLKPEHFDGRVVNAGNPANQTTILALAELVNEACGGRSRVTYTTGRAVHGADYAEAEGHKKTPNISLARSMGWMPVESLDSIVADAVGCLLRAA